MFVFGWIDCLFRLLYGLLSILFGKDRGGPGRCVYELNPQMFLIRNV
jgi:hypothetical protein